MLKLRLSLCDKITFYDKGKIMHIKFENGNEIKTVETDAPIIRSKRSELHSFYCNYCDLFHGDYPIKETHYLGDFVCCQFGFDKILDEVRSV
jgi:hypothetical protein